MPIFRVKRSKGYTIMSNQHLRNKELSLKSKGLLSQMLSLPEDWDFTLKGLASINRESIDAIREAIKELEQAGYIVRSRQRDEQGKLRGTEYVIYEQPQQLISANPMLDKPTLDLPTLENPMQLNKDKQIKEIQSKDISSIHSFSEQSDERNGTEKTDAYFDYEEIIKENIEYDVLLQNPSIDRSRLDEIVQIMLETVCSSRKQIRIAGDDFPADMVKSRFLKLNSAHIEFVLDCMDENTTKIRNIKQYLRAVLFNAPSTMESYYTARVAHDMASRG